MTNSNRIPRTLFIMTLMLMLAGVPLLGQQTDEKHHEEVTIIGTFEPVINEAFKLPMQAPTRPDISQRPEYEFTPVDLVLPTTVEGKPVTPVAINPSTRTKVYQNTLLAGMGSLLSPYAEFFHSSGQRNQHRLNLHIDHHSSFSDIKGRSDSPYSTTGAALDFARYMRNSTFSTGVSYRLNTTRYYGFDPADYPGYVPDDNLKQAIQQVAWTGELKSSGDKQSLNYRVGADARYTFDRHSTTELDGALDFDFFRNYALTDLLDYQHLGLEGTIRYIHSGNSLTDTSSMLLRARPYFNANYGILHFSAGLDFNFLFRNTMDFYFFPELRVSAGIADDALTVMAGIDGQVTYNGYRTLTDLNPWLLPTATLQWERDLRFYGGVRGNIAHRVNFSADVSWTRFRDRYFFVNSPGPNILQPSWFGPVHNTFINLFDDGSCTTLSAQLDFSLNNSLQLWTGITWNGYHLDSLPQPYHKDLFLWRVGADASMGPKFSISTEIIGSGKRYAADYSVLAVVSEVTLPAYVDLNLKLNYKLKENFSVWLLGTNLLNNRYQRYYEYPVQGWELTGGITYQF